MKYFLLLIIIVCTSCNSSERDDIILDDFEKGTYTNWDIQGVSFKLPVHIDSIPFQIKNVHGKYIAFSNSSGEGIVTGQGKLISKNFVIRRKYLNFLVAGGNNSIRQCVNLIIDNRIVKTASGKNDNVLRRTTWNLREFIGKKAAIEIVDAIDKKVEDGSLGHIIVDQIVFSDKRNNKEAVFEDFESGAYTNWDVSGEAFPAPSDRKNVYYPISVDGFNGNYFAFSFGDTHDEKKGKLVSKSFIISHQYIKFLIGGGSHKGETCINLVVNDSIVLSSTGEDDGQLRKHIWNVKDFKNNTARFEIVDERSDRWGHIMVDDIIFYNETVFLSEQIIFGFVMFIAVSLIFSKVYFQSKSNRKLEVGSSDYKKLKKIESLIKTSEGYLNSDYSIKEVLKISDLKEEKINFLFGRSNYLSLPNYVNILRVEKFKKKLNETSSKAFTMISIAESCGFSSKSSFYLIFKKVTGITPSEYKRKIKS